MQSKLSYLIKAKQSILYKLISKTTFPNKARTIRCLSGQADKKVQPDIPFLDEMKKTTSDSIHGIGSATMQYTHEINKVYHDMEQNLMRRINESNTQRFRLILIGTVLIVVWVGAVFGTRIKAGVARQTAGLAKETLENESLKVQTQELATAVVQTVLNDKDITAQAAIFLREATTVPETQEALLQLTLHLLQHPETLKQLNVLVVQLIKDISQDKETMESVSNLFANALTDPIFLKALYLVVNNMSTDPEVAKMLAILLRNVVNDTDVLQSTKTLMMDSAQTVLTDEEIILRSKEFVTDVMGDDTLQKEGGHAIWNSVSHALKPGLRRVVGVGLIVLSVGFVRVLLSPF